MIHPPDVIGKYAPDAVLGPLVEAAAGAAAAAGVAVAAGGAAAVAAPVVKGGLASMTIAQIVEKLCFARPGYYK